MIDQVKLEQLAIQPGPSRRFLERVKTGEPFLPLADTGTSGRVNYMGLYGCADLCSMGDLSPMHQGGSHRVSRCEAESRIQQHARCPDAGARVRGTQIWLEMVIG